MKGLIKRAALLLTVLGASALGGVGCSQATGTPQIMGSGPATPSASGTVAGDLVTLTLDKQHYSASDTIVVTIHNGLSQTIWLEGQQTNCKAVLVERQQGDQWNRVQDCTLLTPAHPVPLAAGSTIAEGVAATQGFLADATGWPAGTYRVSLTYAAGATETAQPTRVVHSAEFVVS